MQRLQNQSFALIADDDAGVRAVLSAVVSRAGLASVPVQDGRRAVKVLADQHPSLAILGVQMPGLSGIEVCWWIRRQRHLAEVPVILIGALPSQSEIDAGLLAGANDFVTKPFTSARITAVVAHHLAERRLLPPARVVIADLTD